MKNCERTDIMNKDYINELDCEIVEDLIPLYHDKAVSEKTKNAVEYHIKSCAACKAEYALYLKDLPKPDGKSTVGEFHRLMKKKRLKQMFTVLVAVVLSALIFQSGYYLLCKVPLVKNDDMQIHQIYRYENNGKTEFFYTYSDPTAKWGQNRSHYYEKDGKKIFELIEKNPIITEVCEYEETNIGTASLTVVDPSAEGDERYPDDIDVIYINGKEVWSKEKNGNDKVPEYVTKGWVDYLNGNNDEFHDTDLINWYWQDDYVEVDYKGEGRVIRWNFDGERIYDSAKIKN